MTITTNATICRHKLHRQFLPFSLCHVVTRVVLRLDIVYEVCVGANVSKIQRSRLNEARMTRRIFNPQALIKHLQVGLEEGGQNRPLKHARNATMVNCLEFECKLGYTYEGFNVQAYLCICVCIYTYMLMMKIKVTAGQQAIISN